MKRTLFSKACTFACKIRSDHLFSLVGVFRVTNNVSGEIIRSKLHMKRFDHNICMSPLKPFLLFFNSGLTRNRALIFTIEGSSIPVQLLSNGKKRKSYRWKEI